jgi:L-histidine N-alpha-methyltransferase
LSAATFDLPAATLRVADDVRRGLLASPKALPPHLFYDAMGSQLYERITELPEYYLTRAERSIFEVHADSFVQHAGGSGGRPLTVVELGAGSAAKTELVLRAVLRRQPRCLYVPIDVSLTAVEDARARLAGALPAVRVRPLVMTHEEAVRGLKGTPAPQLLMFIGSSVGNFEDEEASRLLGGIRHALGPDAVLLLGTDLRKRPDVLIRAYDDAAGVTAAFNKNLLARINRELGGHFDLARWKHVARWNDAASRIEMHLESTVRQEVPIDALGLRVAFEAGETIHTESSIKYDVPRVDRLLEAAGFHRDETYYDDAKRFAVHLARSA